jgi:hypothetical protein
MGMPSYDWMNALFEACRKREPRLAAGGTVQRPEDTPDLVDSIQAAFDSASGPLVVMVSRARTAGHGEKTHLEPHQLLSYHEITAPLAPSSTPTQPRPTRGGKGDANV